MFELTVPDLYSSELPFKFISLFYNLQYNKFYAKKTSHNFQ